jgi:hypothetical protein
LISATSGDSRLGRIAELAGMRDALARLIDTCDHPRAERDCPILHDIQTAAATTTSAAQE